MVPKKASSSKAAESKKRKACKKEKDVLLPPPKYRKTNQTVLSNQTSAWKPSTLKEADIQVLVRANLL